MRQVLLPLRPIDLATQLAEAEDALPGAVNPRDQDGDGLDDETGEPLPPADGAGDGSGSTADDGAAGMTVAECLAANPTLNAQVQALAAADPQVAALVDSFRGQPVSAVPPNPFITIPADCR